VAEPAHVITLGLSGALNNSIRAWFREFDFLPPIPLRAAHIDTVTGPVSFENLLQRLVDSVYTNFILIIHGHEDGSGLHLNLAPGQTKMHTDHRDLQELMDVDAGVAKMNRADMATMGIKKPHIDRLLDLMHRVRQKRIGCIEFRSCNLGRNILALNRFRQFLGARLAGAPDLHTVFGVVPVVIRPDFDHFHMHLHPGGNWETYKFPNALTEPHLVACFQLNALQKPESGGHVATDKAVTLDAWIKQWIMPTGHHTGKQIAMHALWIADRKVVAHDPKSKPRFVPAAIAFEKADLTDPLGGWGGPAVRRLIPPLSENYKKHIIYSR
jgi:hypothetical protein